MKQPNQLFNLLISTNRITYYRPRKNMKAPKSNPSPLRLPVFSNRSVQKAVSKEQNRQHTTLLDNKAQKQQQSPLAFFQNSLLEQHNKFFRISHAKTTSRYEKASKPSFVRSVSETPDSVSISEANITLKQPISHQRDSFYQNRAFLRYHGPNKCFQKAVQMQQSSQPVFQNDQKKLIQNNKNDQSRVLLAAKQRIQRIDSGCQGSLQYSAQEMSQDPWRKRGKQIKQIDWIDFEDLDS